MSATAGSPSGLVAVTFDATSQGQLAMAIYEWQDVSYLGKVTIGDNDLPVSVPYHPILAPAYSYPAENIYLVFK